jgi:hypothetical protein
MGAYAAALWVLGLHQGLDDVAKLDAVGLTRAAAASTNRKRKVVRDDDF